MMNNVNPLTNTLSVLAKSILCVSVGFSMCILSIGCLPQTYKQRNEYKLISGENFRGAIVPAERASEFGIEGQSWTPSEKDVNQFENELKGLLEDIASPSITNNLADYTRQYIGVEKLGQKLIYVNLFCDSLDINWKSTPVFVLDGGECYFQVYYNIESNEINQINVNGES